MQQIKSLQWKKQIIESEIVALSFHMSLSLIGCATDGETRPLRLAATKWDAKAEHNPRHTHN